MPEHLNVQDDELGAIDREISQLLAVQPSPDFAAKVRVRIAAQPVAASGPWRFWMMAAVPAAAVMLLLVATAYFSTRDVQSPSSVHGNVTLPVENNVQLPVIAAADPVPNHRRSLGRPQPVEPEILIDPSLAAAIRRLAAEQPNLPEVPPESSLDPVVVEPLKVPDISDGGTKQGDRQ
jgi:hypothetical protein